MGVTGVVEEGQAEFPLGLAPCAKATVWWESCLGFPLWGLAQFCTEGLS